MISVAVLLIAMLAVSYIFSSVTRTSAITTANIELTDVIETMRQTMQADLNAMAPGLLIIDSPDPNQVAPEPRYIPDAIGEDVIYGDPGYAPRRDRLIFVTTTSPETYQSWYAPGDKTGEAIIHYGHAGINPGNEVRDPIHLPTVAFDRTLLRRAVLLGGKSALAARFPLYHPNTTPPTYRFDDSDPQYRYPDPNFLPDRVAAYRTYFSIDDEVYESASSFFLRLLNHPSTASLRLAYQRSLAGPTTLDIPDVALGLLRIQRGDIDAWRDQLRHCFEFVPRVGHFIVEWTEGESAVGGGLLWYGLYRAKDIDNDGTNDVIYAAPKTDPWPPGANFPIEEEPSAVTPPDYFGYRAVWRVDKDTWDLRPKALRITVRLYDSNKRLRDADERLGQERSFILEVP